MGTNYYRKPLFEKMEIKKNTQILIITIYKKIVKQMQSTTTYKIR
jgi:hypothetical protein